MKRGILTQEHDMNTRLSGKRALSTRSLPPPETWDPLPLSPVCNPYCKPSAGNTSSSELNVGTFRPNQYKPLCPPNTPSDPDAQIQIYSSVVRKHRQPQSVFFTSRRMNSSSCCYVHGRRDLLYSLPLFLPQPL